MIATATLRQPRILWADFSPPQDMADTQANLDALKARRQKLAGIKNIQFDNQSTTTDLEALDREIARMETALTVAAGGSRTRYAAFSKGT